MSERFPTLFCPCGNPATSNYMGSPCCDRCWALDRQRDRHVLKYSQRGIALSDTTNPTETITEPNRLAVFVPVRIARHLPFDLHA